MKRVCSVLALCIVALLLASSDAQATARSRGWVYCDTGNGVIDTSDLPLEGVRVVADGENGPTYAEFTNSDGYFYINLPYADSNPEVYHQTLDPTTIPADASFLVPPSGEFVFNQGPGMTGVINIYLIASAECRGEGKCGDGNVDPGEQCDDGNTIPGDGCDENCMLEDCGNGTVDAGEECDDGNNTPGDGCDENCMLEGDCELIVDKTCCIVPPPAPASGTDCQGKITSLKLEYTGDGCDATNNQQEGKVVCSGDPNGFEPVDMLVSDNNGDYIFADASNVFVGDVVDVLASNGGLSELKADTLVTIDNGLQTVKFHTSCSKPIRVGDQFGGVRITELTSTDGGTVTLPDPDSNESACVAGGNPPPPHCLGKVVEAVFEYTGGTCADSNNPQSGKAYCDGMPGAAPVSIVVTKDQDAVNVTPTSGIAVGDAVSFHATGSELKSELNFNVMGTSTQVLKIHTSCSKPLNLGDIFGSMRLIKLTTTEGGTVEEAPAEPPEGTSECFIPAPQPFACDDHIGSISFRYDAGDCSESNNPQDGKAHCTDYVTGVEPVRVRVFKDAGTVYLDTMTANVNAGDTVTAAASNAGQSSFASTTFVQITNGVGNPVQTLEIHTSCSQPIDLGDRFGSLEIVGLTDQHGNQAAAGATIEYTYTIMNPGAADATDVTVVDDKLGPITDTPIEVAGGDTVVLRKQATISEDTENTVTVSYDQAGGSCPDETATATVLIEEAPQIMECTDRIQAFLFRYIGPAVPGATTVTIKADKFPGDLVVYNLPGGLAPGMELSSPAENGFTIDATAHGQTELGSKTTLYINGVAQVIHTSCSTPFRAGAPAPLDNPKGQPSTLWFVVSFTQK